MFSTSLKCVNVLFPHLTRPLRVLPSVSPLIIWHPSSSHIHSTKKLHGLQEFFDDPENYSKMEVRVGRAWRKDELRLKSNSDLHKLWYVLLKERNMLLTMREVYKYTLMPSPERIHKVEESMKHLEDVVRERNKAYFELETGETGERRSKYIMTRLGIWRMHKLHQHPIPRSMNKEWQEEYPDECDPEVDDFIPTFLSLYSERLRIKEQKARHAQKLYVLGLLKRFPDIDLQLLQEKYPHLKIEVLKKSKAARGHWIPSEYEQRTAE